MITLILSIFLLFLLAVVLWLLLTPIVLTIDTNRSVYSLQMSRWVKLNLLSRNDLLLLIVHLPFFRKEYDLIEWWMQTAQNPKKNKEKPERRKKTETGRFGRKVRRNFVGIFRSFDISRFYLNIDSNNYFLNGMLYPWFYLANRFGLNISCNFKSQNELVLVVRNSLIRLAWAAFR